MARILLTSPGLLRPSPPMTVPTYLPPPPILFCPYLSEPCVDTAPASACTRRFGQHQQRHPPVRGRGSPLSLALRDFRFCLARQQHTIPCLVSEVTTQPRLSSREGSSGDLSPTDLQAAGTWPACSGLEPCSPRHHYRPVPTRGLGPFPFSLIFLKPWCFGSKASGPGS